MLVRGCRGGGEGVPPPLSVLLAGAQLSEELLAFGEEAFLLLGAVGRSWGGGRCSGSRFLL